MTRNELGSHLTDISLKTSAMKAHTSLARKSEAQENAEKLRFEPCGSFKTYPLLLHNTHN